MKSKLQQLLAVLSANRLLASLTPLRLWLLTISAAVILTECMVVIMELLLKGVVTYDYLLTGLITSVLVSAFLAAIMVNLISTQRYAKDLLEKSQNQLNEAQRIAEIGSWEWRIDEDQLQWSDEIFRIFGVSPHNFKPSIDAFIRCVHPEDRPMMQAVCENVLQGLPTLDMEHRILRPDGVTVHVRERGELSLDQITGARRFTGTTQNISQHKAAESKIRHLAFYDALTGLPNRQLLMDRLGIALVSCGRSQHSGALLFIDLDNFKTLNDALGHDIGDLLLKQAAKRINACIRQSDTASRFGGDEFVVILDNLNADSLMAAADAKNVAEKILAAFSEPFLINRFKQYSTASIGIALFNSKSDGAEVALKQAELAMYQAKTASRNTLRFFDPKMQEQVNAHVRLEASLRQALESQQFLLYFQPQLNMHAQITGAEALVRWQHPEQGLVPPGEFIPVAEETGLIVQLGHWVLTTACQQLVKWSSEPEAQHLTLAVNISVRQFFQGSFVEDVFAILEETGANPAKLKLEITESLLVDDMEATIAKMQRLKNRGISFSLDDFGTSYSSLSYLKRMPLDELKIDLSFMTDVPTNQNNAAIVRTIINLGRSLNLAVIAEGVETEGQREFLALHGCSGYQGYLFSKPLPVKSFDALLLNSIEA